MISNVSQDHLAAQASSSSNSLLYRVSILKEKVRQLQSIVTILISSPPDHRIQPAAAEPTSSTAAMANMGSLVQEIIITASSLMVTYHQMIGSTSGNNNNIHNNNTSNEILQQQQQQSNFDPNNNDQERLSSSGQGLYFTEAYDTWYGDNNDYVNNNNCDTTTNVIRNNNNNATTRVAEEKKREILSSSDTHTSDDIIELDAADLLAKYTHYCQVCGKGFKRDANLRMHMRAHGDEYKTSAALTNPLKNSNNNGNSIMGNNNEAGAIKATRKYSCPQEGCRWNKKHAKFQPLKSMICVKNHYKRSHCPKMYACKRCNRKQFSVLSDLRTHEKHCGDLKWQCSCGTTFSRKDKLMGHVALFVGHTPAILNVTSINTAKVGAPPSGTNAIRG